MTKPTYLKLFANYSGKDKAIGITTVDLAQFLNKNLNEKPQKLLFQKCFDKAASVSISLKYKEIFDPIQETVTEEGELSQFDEEEDSNGKNNEMCDTSRFSILNSTREYLQTDINEQEDKSSRNTTIEVSKSLTGSKSPMLNIKG